MCTHAIKRAVELVGSQTKLANALGVTQGLVWQWVNGMRSVGSRRCIPIEEATHGLVTRYELRPDVFGAAPERAP